MTLLDADPTTGGIAASIDDETQAAPRRLPPLPSLGALRFTATNPANRIGWTIACALLVALAVQVWTASFLFPGAGIPGVLMIPIALFGMVRCWTDPNGPSKPLQTLILIATGTFIAVTTVAAILSAPFYGTDAVAFGQYAAELVAKGQNPYTHSMLPSLTQYHVPVIYSTHFFDGHAMDKVSYPAGNFLPYVPFILLGWHAQTAVVINVAFWILTGFLLWALLPSGVRFAAPLLLGAPYYMGFAIGGVNDTLYLPFLMLAVWRWDRYAVRDEKSIARWLGPVAMGIAMTMKQQPWFAFPFLVLGIAIEARRRGERGWKTPTRYVATAAAVFFAINAPWIAADPSAWWGGSVAPLLDTFIPQGQGLINLTLAQGLGGGHLSYYTYAGALWVLFCLAAMAFRYGSVKRVWLPMVIAAFFFTPRSLGNYLMMMLPAAVVAAASVRDAAEEPIAPVAENRTNRFAKPVLGLVLAGALGAAMLALISPAPLKMTIDGTRTNGQRMQITDVIVTIHNQTGNTEQPHFAINNNGYVTNFWYPTGSHNGDTSITLAPHATQQVSLHAPDTSSMPSIAAPFQVLAYIGTPTSISTTSPYTNSIDTIALTPSAVDAPAAVGQPVRFTAQLTDRLGRNAHKAGVKIALGQVIYAASGLLGGDASIQGQIEGASPGYAVTDANGQANFTVIGRQVHPQPTYFQAWVPGSDNNNPSGYSNIVTIQFYNR